MHTLALARRHPHGDQRRAHNLFCLDRHSGQNAAELLIAGTGKVLVAAVGTVAPVDLTSAWGVGWKDLGFTDPTGVKLTDTKAIYAATVWQGFYPARRSITSRDFSAAFVLAQFNKDTVPLALGGGTVSTLSAGVYKYAPPDSGLVDERALGVEIIDGTKIYRLIVPRGLVTDNVATDFTRTKEALLPIAFGATSTGVGDPYDLLTNDPSWA